MAHSKEGQTFLELLRKLLEHRYFPVTIAAFAVVMMLPALNTGFFQDDLFHRLKLVSPNKLPRQFRDTGIANNESGTLATALLDMHTVVRSHRDLQMLTDSGILPWWTPHNFRFANFRPLDAFTHWLDYRLFPDAPVPMHVHSICWFATVVFLVTILYRKLLAPVWVASLAAILYAIDDNNFFPTMWIANRNLLISLVFSMLCLLMHHRWRENKSVDAGVASIILLLLSLLASEAGIAACAYLFAYELMLDRGSWFKRSLSLVPAFLLIVVWRLIYNSMGYGAFGSDFVVDPGREPLRYAGAVLERATILLMGQWSWQPADFFYFVSDYARRWNLIIAAAFLLLVLIVLLPLLRKSRLALFWFVGMLLCVLPICATAPTNRNLLFVAIGAFGLIAQFLAGLFAKDNWVPKSRLYRVPVSIVCWSLIAIHIIFAGLGRMTAPKFVTFAFDTFYTTFEFDSPPGLEDKTVLAVNAPAPFMFAFAQFLRAYKNQPLPKAIRILAPGFRPLKVTRTGEKTLAVKARAGNLLSVDSSRKDFRLKWVYLYSHYNSFFRSDRQVFEVSQCVKLKGMAAEVEGIDGRGQPTVVSFHFDISLDDSSLYWLQWDWKKNSYVPFNIPAVGKSCEIAGPF